MTLDQIPGSAEPCLIACILRYNNALSVAQPFTARLLAAIDSAGDYRQFGIAAKALKKYLWTLDLGTRLFVVERVASKLVISQLFRPSARLLVSLLAERSPIDERRRIAAPICDEIGRIADDSLLGSIGGWCSLVSHLIRAFEGEQCLPLSSVCFFLFEKARENTPHFLHYAFFVFSAVCRNGNLDEASANTLLVLATDAIQRTASHFDCCAALMFLREAFRRWFAQVTGERVGFLVELWRTVRPLPAFLSCVDYLASIFLIIAEHLPQAFVADVLEAFPPRAERSLTAEMCARIAAYFGCRRERQSDTAIRSTSEKSCS
jgi:hypothetical protein